MINVHYAKQIRNPFTSSFSNACRHTKQFWKKFQYYFYPLTREFVCLTLQDVITGILCTNCLLLNYMMLIAKLYLWGCKRNQTLPIIIAFSSKVKIKYETENYICVTTNKMDKLNKKWVPPLDSVPLCRLYSEHIFHFLYSYFTVKVHGVV